MKTVLPFASLPKGLPFGRKITYCMVDISGIQQYIFHAMDRHTTPQQIQHRSAFVEQLTRHLQQQLSQMPGYLFGSDVSGKLLCGFHPRAKASAIRAFLDRMQRTVFASTGGQLTFYYALCTAQCILQSRMRPGDMQHAGSVLGRQLETQKLHCLNLLHTLMDQDADPQLIPADISLAPTAASVDQAVVKLDLDNLGAFFNRIPAYDQHHQVSKALEAVIKSCQRADPRIVNIFAGGDDIFFLCPLNDYLSVIAQFYRRLKKMLMDDPALCLYAQAHFGISAGVCVLRNKLDNIPLSSYWESAEDALTAAKTKGNKNCVYIRLPSKNLLHIRWDDLCFLADIYLQLQEPLHQQHRFSGADLINISLLADQLSICGKGNHLLTKKELSRLYEIKKRSV